jgi:hypothetical protein
MRRSIVTLLLVLEPLHFGFEASRVLSTIAYRGRVAAIELGAHAIVAVVCAGAALAFWNGGPDARRWITIAAVASVARTIQSVYWSVLPDDTRPGDELIVALTAMALGTITLVLGRLKPAPTSADGRLPM